MDPVEFSVFGDVYRALSPNLRLHHMELYRRKQTWKTRARLAWHQSGCPEFHGRVRLTLTLRRGRRCDPDNAFACTKSLIDGLKSEPGRPGLFVDDSSRWLELTVQQEVSPRWKGPKAEVLVRAEPLEEA